MAKIKITGDRFGQLVDALVAAGVVAEPKNVRRVVVDIRADCAVTVHVEAFGDERTLDVLSMLLQDRSFEDGH